jgi:hypothetical protein
MKKIGSLLVVFLVMFVAGCGGKSSSLEGKVVDGKGQPLSNVKVAAKMAQPIKGYEQFETTTGADGTFKFSKLFPTSEYQLILYSERWKGEKKMKTDSGPEGETKMLPEPMIIRFMETKEGVVMDTKTNLMWATEDNGDDITWGNAKSYCDNYRGGGYTDWRMPTQDDLAGLYNPAKTYKSDCGHDVHLTALIRLTCFWAWASETRGSDAADFGFTGDGRFWHPQLDATGARALPVRSVK